MSPDKPQARGSQPGVRVPLGVHLIIWKGIIDVINRIKRIFLYSLFPNIYTCYGDYLFAAFLPVKFLNKLSLSLQLFVSRHCSLCSFLMTSLEGGEQVECYSWCEWAMREKAIFKQRADNWCCYWWFCDPLFMCLLQVLCATWVVGNRGLSGHALFFVCFLYSPLKNAHFISQAYHWNAPTVDDVTSTLSDLWPLFPRFSCLPQDSSVCPQFSLPVALSVCVEVLS